MNPQRQAEAAAWRDGGAAPLAELLCGRKRCTRPARSSVRVEDGGASFLVGAEVFDWWEVEVCPQHLAGVVAGFPGFDVRVEALG